MERPRRFYRVGSISGGFIAFVVTVGTIVKYNEAVRFPAKVALLLMWIIFSISLVAGIKKKNLSYLRSCRALLIVFGWMSLTVMTAIMVQVVVNHENHKFHLKVLLPMAITVVCSMGGIFALSLWIVNVIIGFIIDLQPKRPSQQPLMSIVADSFYFKFN